MRARGIRPLKLRDGHHLHLEERGRGDALLLVHGFTGSVEAWGDGILDVLARHYRVLAVDLLGHGRSSRPHDAERYRMEEVLLDLLEVLDAVGVEHARWVGYSMGGRVALAGAILHPGRVAGLVLESASPGLEAASDREERRRADEALARRLEAEGIEPFVAGWMALPLFATQRRLPPETLEAARRRRLRNEPLALAASLRGLGTGVQPSFWDRLHEIGAPTLLLTGAEDGKFTGLARRMSAEIPEAVHKVVPRAGHTVHLEAPGAWLEAVVDSHGDLAPGTDLGAS